MTIPRVSNALWGRIAGLSGQRLATPANQSHFSVQAVSAAHVTVTTRGNSTLNISRDAFEQALDYLHIHGHKGQANHIDIGSNKTASQAGPLCQAARTDANGNLGRMVITYVLPILEACGAVHIARTVRPSNVWLP